MKNILITGARSGIAHHVIEQLLNKEYHIYAAVHTEMELKRIQQKYQENIHVTCLKLDITDENDWNQLEQLDIDVYFANAAIGMGGTILNMDIDRIRENYEVNVFANLKLLQHILQKMEKRGVGKVIMMTSLAGIMPIPFLGSYCSTKASLIKWMECLRLELLELKSPIQLSIIEPGLYKTGFNEVMFENKYPELENDHYFDDILEFLHKQDTLLLKLTRKDIKVIASKINKAIEADHPKFIYRSPFSQVLCVKIFQLFFE